MNIRYKDHIMTTMRGWGIRKHGGPEVLESFTLAKPSPGPGQVRVAVKAVALNHLDLWVRKGGPAFRHLQYPHCLGSDITGVVDAIGEGVVDIAIGQKTVIQPGISCGMCSACLSGHDNLCRNYKILGENTQGGCAEYIIVPQQNIAPYPERLDFTYAAAAGLTFMTAWQMLVHKARIAPGKIVLIHGAASGVGVAALQIAKLFRATVIATASSQKKLDFAKSQGATHCINYREQRWDKQIETVIGKRCIDIVFEHVGGETFSNSLTVLANGGCLVTCGATAGATPQVDLRHVFFRQLQILGSTMGSKADLLTTLDHVAKGDFEPVVHQILPIANIVEAHKILESRQAIGKVVLQIDHT